MIVEFTEYMKFLLKTERGIALIFVLWVLTLLSVLAGEFCHTLRIEINITRNFKEETQAYYIAQAGCYTAIWELLRPAGGGQGTADRGQQTDERTTIQWRINADIPEIPFGQGSFKVRIDNESGKINLNRADGAMLKLMLNRFELSDQEKNIIVDSILDWRDEDSLHRVNGAETDYYRSLPKPYYCKNGDFDSVEELLLVRGMTRKLFDRGLKDMLTVYTAGTKPQLSHQPQQPDKININAASSLMLRALPLMTDELVANIMEYRQKKDFASTADLLPMVGPEVYAAILPYIGVQMSSVYVITSEGRIGNSPIRQTIQRWVIVENKLQKEFRIIR